MHANSCISRRVESLASAKLLCDRKKKKSLVTNPDVRDDDEDDDGMGLWT